MTELLRETHRRIIALRRRRSNRPAGVEFDAKGFVVTRDGFATSMPGVFAVGDVRAGSIKRVASAVGEGSVVISAVHSYLAGTTSPP